MITMISVFFSGVSMMAFAACALFFLRFWRVSGDRFFLRFSIACALISFERLVSLFIPATFSGILTRNDGAATWIYLIRLAAFGLIFFAVVIKNRTPEKS